MLPRACTFFVVLAASACHSLFYSPEVTSASNSESATDTTDSSSTPTTAAMTPGCDDDCTTPGEKCGDGNQDPGEDCDDGNSIDGDGCEGNCRLPVTVECGDGTLSPGEQCDDGNTMSGDGCESNCTITPKCGDGVQGPGEQCDDGNSDDDDSCLASCVPADCGDGIVWTGMEECDEGAMNGTYGHCNADCSGPGEGCGDGTRNGPEECDDANQVDDDDCSTTCIAPRLVFVTAARFTGNLGGVVGADAKCTQAAVDGLLSGDVEWRAWISDGTLAPASPGRIDTEFNGYYKLTDGAIIAHGWSELSDGDLAQAINITENKTPAEDPLAAWSNATTAGLPVPDGVHCNKWTSMKMADQGRYGNVDASNGEWTDVAPFACSSQHHLYCFQNSPPP